MRSGIFGLALALAACGHDVPEHDVRVTSDCNGAVQSARFHFDAIDFETSCSGGLFEGTCNTNYGIGRRRSGDLEVHEFILEGLEEFGPSRYALELPKNEVPSTDDLHPYVWCGWYVNESLEPEEGKRQSCYYSTEPCWAEIEVTLE